MLPNEDISEIASVKRVDVISTAPSTLTPDSLAFNSFLTRVDEGYRLCAPLSKKAVEQSKRIRGDCRGCGRNHIDPFDGCNFRYLHSAR